jgi:hypothetical protein
METSLRASARQPEIEKGEIMTSIKTRLTGLAGLAFVALTVVTAVGAATVDTQTADVRGQGPGSPVVAEDGATLQRSDSGLSAKVRMPTPEPGTYLYPPAQTKPPAPFTFPAAVPGHPEAYSLWMFVFNYPALCSVPCDSNDIGPATPARGGAFNVAGHVVGGPNLSLDGHVSMNSSPFGGSMLLEPRTAEVHLAVAPHGALDPALLPDQITKPIGSPPFWWIAVFNP